MGEEPELNEKLGSAGSTGGRVSNKVIWLIGLSGAGKTTIAEAAARRFGAELLDGDTIRDFFSNSDFSREGRERHLLGIAKMAALISKHTPVICSFITPYEDVREKILQILPRGSTMVHVSTTLEVCEDRDVKGLYAKARSGEISNFTGITDPWPYGLRYGRPIGSSLRETKSSPFAGAMATTSRRSRVVDSTRIGPRKKGSSGN